MITGDTLRAIYGDTMADENAWALPIWTACQRYGITTRLRLAAFLAQIGHESGRLHYVKEIFGPTLAQKRYEGRLDLGNTQPGDGKRYMGRGLIQITGRSNYDKLGQALGQDFVAHPELLEKPEFAVLSAAWFWDSRKLNVLADKPDFLAITKKINGGYNGLADRQALYDRALKVLV